MPGENLYIFNRETLVSAKYQLFPDRLAGNFANLVEVRQQVLFISTVGFYLRQQEAESGFFDQVYFYLITVPVKVELMIIFM